MSPDEMDDLAEQQAADLRAAERAYANDRPHPVAFAVASLAFTASAVLMIYGVYGLAILLGFAHR